MKTDAPAGRDCTESDPLNSGARTAPGRRAAAGRCGGSGCGRAATPDSGRGFAGLEGVVSAPLTRAGEPVSPGNIDAAATRDTPAAGEMPSATFGGLSTSADSAATSPATGAGPILVASAPRLKPDTNRTTSFARPGR